jgi:MATE family multidrug resistance protein
MGQGRARPPPPLPEGTSQFMLALSPLDRRIWRVSVPIILSNITVPLLGAVDTAVVGHLPGPHPLGAVAVGTLIFNVLYFGVGFLRMGTTGLTAQALGRGDATEARSALLRASAVGAAIAAVLLVAKLPIIWAAMLAVGPGPEVQGLAERYFAVRIWGAPAALLNFAILGWLIGLQRTSDALWLQVTASVVNIGLDFLLVMGLGWNVEGVAVASIAGQFAAAAMGLLLVRRNARRLDGRWAWEAVLDASPLKRLWTINRDIFIRTAFLFAGQIVFVSIGARSGDAILAANAVLFQFHHIAAWTMDGFAHAAESLAGNAAGARDAKAFRAIVIGVARWGAGLALVFTLVFAVAGGPLIDLLTGVAEVRAVAREYMPWAVAVPLLTVWGFMLDGVFIGAIWTAAMRNAMMVSVVAYVAMIAILVPAFGNHGLWLAYCLFAVVRAGTLAMRYPRLERSLAGA